jgi:hypothetical protein
MGPLFISYIQLTFNVWGFFFINRWIIAFKIWHILHWLLELSIFPWLIDPISSSKISTSHCHCLRFTSKVLKVILSRLLKCTLHKFFLLILVILILILRKHPIRVISFWSLLELIFNIGFKKFCARFFWFHFCLGKLVLKNERWLSMFMFALIRR